ncbi:MAG: DUF1178 family protein [Tabrizicola sp.]
MIRFTLTCSNGHSFESWFQSDKAFADLSASGQLSCPVCGLRDVSKSLMAPNVRPARKAATPPAQPSTSPNLSAPASEVEAAFAEMRRQIEANSDYVGVNFVAEARAMHEGTVPERSIYGEARPEEARKLLEEGIPVAPLPFMPKRKTN